MRRTTSPAAITTSSSSSPTRDVPLTGEAYRNFANAIRTSKTKTLYNFALSKFLTFSDIDSVDTLITVDSRLTTARIIDFVVYEKEKGTSYGSLCAYLAGIRKFYELNDVVLNWKKIKMYLPEKKKVQHDRAYRREEIKRILDVCDIRKRVIVLLMCSTGMRIGAIADLRLKNLHKIQLHHQSESSTSIIYRITIYEKAAERYYTFCTPECAKAIDDYLNYRIQYGEKLTPESPLLRDQFDKTDILSVTNAKPLSHNTIAVMVHQALIDASLRKPAQLVEEENNKKKTLYNLRYDIMQSHGFRKFFQIP
jgi:integrase